MFKVFLAIFVFSAFATGSVSVIQEDTNKIDKRGEWLELSVTINRQKTTTCDRILIASYPRNCCFTLMTTHIDYCGSFAGDMPRCDLKQCFEDASDFVTQNASEYAIVVSLSSANGHSRELSGYLKKASIEGSAFAKAMRTALHGNRMKDERGMCYRYFVRPEEKSSFVD